MLLKTARIKPTDDERNMNLKVLRGLERSESAIPEEVRKEHATRNGSADLDLTDAIREEDKVVVSPSHTISPEEAEICVISCEEGEVHVPPEPSGETKEPEVALGPPVKDAIEDPKV